MHSPGIEPGSPAWQADIMPLDHECLVDFAEFDFLCHTICASNLAYHP